MIIFPFGFASSLTEEESGRNTNDVSSVISSACWDLDSTILASYNGSDTHWRNLVASPADGNTQSSYDMMLGAIPTPHTTDPTFNGTAGDEAAYWSNDGGDQFKSLSQTDFAVMNNAHKDTAGEFWFAMAFYYPERFAGNGVEVESKTSGNGFQINGRTNDSGGFPYIIDMQTNGVRTTETTVQAGTYEADNIMICSLSRSAGKYRFWMNTTTGEEGSFTFNAGTANNQFQTRVYTSAPPDSKFYTYSGGNEFIDDSKAADIINLLQARHPSGRYSIA